MMDLWPPFSGFLDHTHTDTRRDSCTSDQPVTETSTYTGQQNRQISMPREGFEPAIPVTTRPQTYALDRAATGICVFVTKVK
jgi:hypothetical protein